MKKLILSLVLALTVLSPLSTVGVNTAKAGAYLTTNSAIRGTSTETVYWYATDGKRYVFPNAQSFYSWFPNFSNVSTITDAELYAITIGGNVTFRPGAKLVKVNTDPKVYAVSRGGVLRHVTSEYLATQLYGSDWNTKVADIADVYFTNYTVGTPIYSTSDYNVSNEYNGVTTPSDSLRSQGQSLVFTLEADRTSITSGQPVVLTARTNFGRDYLGQLAASWIEIRNANGTVLKRCSPIVTICSVTVYPIQTSGQSSVMYNAYTDNGIWAPLNINFNGSSTQTGTLTLTADRTTFASGEGVTFTAIYNGTIPSGGKIEFRQPQYPFNLQAECFNTNTCSRTLYANVDALYNSISVSASVYNINNVQVANKSLTIYRSGISTGYGENSINGLVLNADRTSINSGELVHLTANAFNSGTWSYVGNRIEISSVNTGQILRTCYDVATCTLDVYPQARSATNLTAQYQTRIYDRTGALAMSQYSPVIYLNGTTVNTSPNSGSMTGTGSVSYGPTENLRTNRMMYLTTTFLNSNLAVADAKVELYVENLSTPLATCLGSYTCAVSYATGATPISTRVYARLSNRNNASQWLETPRVALTTTW